MDKDCGLQEVEDEAWSKPNISSCCLSQYLLASTFFDEVSHPVHVSSTLFNSIASSFNQEANIEEPYFYVSLEGEFSSRDTNDEKEVTYGADADMYYYPITHSLFSKSPILDFEICVLDFSHSVHTSLMTYRMLYQTN